MRRNDERIRKCGEIAYTAINQALCGRARKITRTLDIASDLPRAGLGPSRHFKPESETESATPDGRREPPPRGTAAHAGGIRPGELLDAVFRAFAADPAFLHAAERGDLGRDDALVDADDAVFEPLGDELDAADVTAVEIGGETEFGVVGHLDRLIVGLEAVGWRQWPKGLLLGDDHVGRSSHRSAPSARRRCRPVTRVFCRSPPRRPS